MIRLLIRIGITTGMVMGLVLWGSNLVWSRCAGGNLILPQVLRCVKDRVLPYNVDEDTRGYLEDMIWARYLGEKNLGPIDDPEARSVMEAVVSGDCSKLSGAHRDVCIGLVRNDESKFLSGAVRILGDDMMQKRDLHLMYYIYQYYSNPSGFKEIAEKDLLGAYVYLFLSDPDCSCRSAEKVNRWFSLLPRLTRKKTLPGMQKGLPEVLRNLLGSISAKDWAAFKKAYF